MIIKAQNLMTQIKNYIKLKNITAKIDSLEKIYHNLSHLKVKEYNILKGKRTQIIECIEVIQKYYS